MDQDNNSVEFWQEKCASLENTIKVLSTHCTKVIQKHQELLVSYKKNQDQYNALVQKLSEQRAHVKRAREVLEPVTREYQALREKYEIAICCQEEAEKFATKVNKSNKKLKRQSQMLLSQVPSLNAVDVNMDDDETDGKTEESDYCEKLDEQIKALSEERSALKAQVKELWENYNTEKEQNGFLKQKLDSLTIEHQQAVSTIDVQKERLRELTETSEAALQEYKDLAEDYAKQIVDKEIAREKQKELSVESKAAKRQSAMLMSKVAGDEPLQRSLIEVEDLTVKVETVRVELQEKIDNLEVQLRQEKERHGVTDLESENLTLTEEKDSLLSKLATSETTAADLQKQYTSLLSKYEDLETKYERALKAPIPPPPPPPPPPPVPKTSGILGLISSGKKKRKAQLEQRLKTGGAALDTDYSKALKEMMDRIQSGKALRPTLKSRSGRHGSEGSLNFSRKKSLPDEEKSAMSELEGVLNNMKRAKSEDDLTDGVTFNQPGGVRESSDLGQVFQKILAKKNKEEKSFRPTPLPRKHSVINEETEAEEQ